LLIFQEQQRLPTHKISNEYFDIKNSFQEVILPAGVNNTQFEITFKTDKKIGFQMLKNQIL
jgi:hypothetical protein